MKRMQEVKATNIKSVVTTIVAVGCIFGLTGALIKLNNDKEKTVDVVMVKDELYPNGLITEGNIEKDDIPYSLYTKYKGKDGQEYLLWKDKDECLNQYSLVYTKKYICKGDYEPTRPIKNEWLTQAEEGSIFISIPYNKNEAFGNIVTPGDYLKVGISYKAMETGTDALGYSVEQGKDIEEILYDRIQVVDMLNAKGNSIYDYYTDLLSLSVKDREEKLRDESFLTDVSPTDILLKVTATTDFDKYLKITKYSSLKYTYGLYPRIEDDTILTQFRDLTRQITAAQIQVTKKDGEK